jgi:hypothetical protein
MRSVSASDGVKFDGIDTLLVGGFANPVWIKVGGMTLQITPTDTGVIVDAWRKDDAAMSEPWTVEFDGSTMETR